MATDEPATAPVRVRHHSGSELEVSKHERVLASGRFTVSISFILSHRPRGLQVHRFGATVSSFKDASGCEWFEMSPIAVYDGKKPLRGGIPVVFPQFGEGPLPKHGFARNTMWGVEQEGDGFVELSLCDDDSSREIWPHCFRLVYRVSFTGDTLTATLRCATSSCYICHGTTLLKRS